MNIENPNTSGQGFCADHANHQFHSIALEFGYTYSHTTRVYAGSGWVYFWHTYKHGAGKDAHNLGFAHSEATGLPTKFWDTSTSCASGHKWEGMGETELRAHLKSKARRYNLKKKN